MVGMGKVEDELVPKGVYIITTKATNRKGGMTASWVSRVAGKPPVMMVAIHHRSHTGGLIRESGRYVINIIDRKQLEVARRFGLSTGHRVDKFQEFEFVESGNGLPVLKGCLGYLECNVMEQIVVGDHTVFFGEIIEENLFGTGIPMLFSSDDFYAGKETK
jgi:flavin reductase (DIM6/NTAB) family NADH-FMN oxidoreductase RutF